MVSIVLLAILVIALTIGASGLDQNVVNALGLPQTITVDNHSLDLVATGMRRKKILLFEVDVYKVGIYANQLVDRSLSRSSGTDISSSLVAVMEAEQGDPQLAIVLHFVRNVQLSIVVETLVEGLLINMPEMSESETAAYQAAVQALRSEIIPADTSDENTNAATSIEADQQIIFVFSGGSDRSFSIIIQRSSDSTSIEQNNVRIQSIHLQQRLIDIYIGANAVAPAVHSNLKVRWGSAGQSVEGNQSDL